MQLQFGKYTQPEMAVTENAAAYGIAITGADKYLAFAKIARYLKIPAISDLFPVTIDFSKEGLGKKTFKSIEEFPDTDLPADRKSYWFIKYFQENK